MYVCNTVIVAYLKNKLVARIADITSWLIDLH